jgi:hypothetical protein
MDLEPRPADPDNPAPMSAAGLAGWMAGCRWVYAKTMPEIPHEYTLRRRQDPATFDRAVAFIRAHGWRARWGRSWHTYYSLGAWKLWTMGAPVGPATPLVNRALLEPGEPGYQRDLVGWALAGLVEVWAEEALAAADRLSLPVDGEAGGPEASGGGANPTPPDHSAHPTA